MYNIFQSQMGDNFGGISPSGIYHLFAKISPASTCNRQMEQQIGGDLDKLVWCNSGWMGLYLHGQLKTPSYQTLVINVIKQFGTASDCELLDV